MHEIAEAAAWTLAHLILTTACLVKVRHGRQFTPNGLAVEPALIQIGNGLFAIFFVAKLDICITSEMLTQIVANVHLLDLAILGLHLDEQLLEDVVEVLLQLCLARFVQYLAIGGCLGRIERINVEILEEHCLAECGPVVHFAALLAVSARADLEIE